jgi:hypothetical protein
VCIDCFHIQIHFEAGVSGRGVVPRCGVSSPDSSAPMVTPSTVVTGMFGATSFLSGCSSETGKPHQITSFYTSSSTDKPLELVEIFTFSLDLLLMISWVRGVLSGSIRTRETVSGYICIFLLREKGSICDKRWPAISLFENPYSRGKFVIMSFITGGFFHLYLYTVVEEKWVCFRPRHHLRISMF